MKRILSLLNYIGIKSPINYEWEMSEITWLFKRIEEEDSIEMQLEMIEGLIQKTQTYIKDNSISDNLYQRVKDKFNALKECEGDYCSDAHHAWNNHLPMKRMWSGVLIMNENWEVLCLKTSYKKSFEIPGWVVEENESPLQTCLRESKEELWVDLWEISFLWVEYYSENINTTEALMWIFGKKIQKTSFTFSIDWDEIIDFKWVSKDDIHRYVTTSTLANRIVALMDEFGARGAKYLENGVIQ